ncbi:MAG: hypothetical protein LLF89_03895 [Spirochaetaceae bacterium]|nr:hypothetical protein [Spirochaetaceae bacterium]
MPSLSVIMALLIAAACTFGYITVQGKNLKIANMEADLVESQATVEALKVDRDSKEAAEKVCEANVADIRASNEKMQGIVTSSYDLIRRLRKEKNERPPLPAGVCDCPAIRIEGEYAKVISVVIDNINGRYRVRGKVVDHPDKRDGDGAAKILPAPNAPAGR